MTLAAGQRLKTELLRFCEECPSRISGREARRRIDALLAKSECSVAALRDFWANPETNLGPFDALPGPVQEALSDAAFSYHQEGNFRTSERLYKRARGSVYRLGCRVTHRGWKWRVTWRKRKLRRVLAKAVFLFGRAVTTANDVIVNRWIAATRFTGLSRTSFLLALWKYADVDCAELVQRYISNISIDPSYGPVFVAKGKRLASCALSGLDLVPSAGRIYLVESNFNPGFRAKRLSTFPEGDPVCISLVNYAATRGYSQIVFFPFCYRALLPPELEAAWRQIAASRGVALEVRDDPAFTSPYRQISDPFIDPDADGTLYVSGRHWDCPLSTLIREKGRLERLIERHNAGVPEESRITVPRRIRRDDELPPFDRNGRFPNLIVKNALVDRTRGISLFKADKLPASAAAWPNTAFEFVAPDCVARSDGNREDVYAISYRAYLLIAPDGPVYLGTRKDISAQAVPASLPVGSVEDIKPYIVNLHLGDTSVQPEPREDEAIREVVLRIGTVVDEFLKQKHQLVVDTRNKAGALA